MTDCEQLKMVKEALHVSTAPSTIVCREEEQNVVLEFCKGYVKHQKAGSLYICGCPGTGKSLSMEKIKGLLLHWVTQADFLTLDVLSANCTSLVNTSDIFTKIFGELKVARSSKGVFLSQSEYTLEFLSDAGYLGSKHVETPMDTSTKLSKEGGTPLLTFLPIEG